MTRNETLTALIKSLNCDGGKIAPKCAKLFEMVGTKLVEHENILHSDVIREALGELYFATTELQTMRSLNKSHGYVTKQEVESLRLELTWRDRLEIIAIALIGGALGGMAVFYG